MNYQVMPPLTADDFDALRADIAARGVMVPVEYDDAGNVLDGHHRIRACQELGITDWPRMIRQGLTEPQKRAHARALNLARRHLTQEQRRDLADARADTIRLDWLEDRNNTIGAILLPYECVRYHPDSLRDAIDAAMALPQNPPEV